MIKSIVLLEFFTIVGGILLALWVGYGFVIEGGVDAPQYTVLKKEGAIEIRDYPSLTLIKTTISESYPDNTSGGFRVLFRYISGNNVRNQKIPMTAPVLHGKPYENDRTMMAFLLPSDMTKEKAPSPTDDAALLDEWLVEQVAVISFKGRCTTKKINKFVERLETWLVDQNLSYRSSYLVAQYNSPYVFPLFRKNEIWIFLDHNND